MYDSFNFIIYFHPVSYISSRVLHFQSHATTSTPLEVTYINTLVWLLGEVEESSIYQSITVPAFAQKLENALPSTRLRDCGDWLYKSPTPM